MQEALSVTVTRYVNIVLADDNSKPVLVGTGYQPIAKKKIPSCGKFSGESEPFNIFDSVLVNRLLFLLVETYKNTFFLH